MQSDNNISSFKDKAFTNSSGYAHGNAQVYTSGYFGVYFQLPDSITGMVGDNIYNAKEMLSSDNMAHMLASACTGFQPPDRQIEAIDIPRMGGSSWKQAGKMNLTNDVTIKFIEYSGAPISKIIGSWFSQIRKFETGTQFQPNINYKGHIYAWTVDPSLTTVQRAWCFAGAWPTQDPLTSFDNSIENIEKVELSVQFTCDYPYSDAQWVYTKCQDLNNQFKSNDWDSVVSGKYPTDILGITG